MTAPFPMSRNDYRLREEAWRIAWAFLDGTGQTTQTPNAHAILSEVIQELMNQGVANRLRLANLAIVAYQQRIAARDRPEAGPRAAGRELVLPQPGAGRLPPATP